jgi:tetratricopeptide (TPR) repeat protein
MKSFFVIIALCSVLAVQAQSEKYVQAIQHNLSLLDSTKSTADFQSVSAAFERIGEAEKTQWLPYYYAALAQVRIGFTDKSADKDAVATKALALVSKEEAMENNADLCTVRNMAATLQMMVDPMSRWQTYGPQAAAALQTAIKLNPENPRIYYLQAMSLYGTPPQFGGGKDKAKPLFEKAAALAKAEQVKPLFPHWGGAEAEKMIPLCQ